MWFSLHKYFLQKKNYNNWIKSISKKITTTGSANTCNFFCIFEKMTTTGSSHFLSPNGQGLNWHLFHYYDSKYCQLQELKILKSPNLKKEIFYNECFCHSTGTIFPIIWICHHINRKNLPYHIGNFLPALKKYPPWSGLCLVSIFGWYFIAKSFEAYTQHTNSMDS